jgi:hypothetical protein
LYIRTGDCAECGSPPETTASNISRPQILSSPCRLSRRKWSCVELHCETQLRFLRALRRCGCATSDCRRGAYIKSQAHEGWRVMGSLRRSRVFRRPNGSPALQKLLADVRDQTDRHHRRRQGPSREAGRAWRRPISFQSSGTQWVGGLLSGDHIIFIAEHGDIPMSVHAMTRARLSSLRSSLVIRIRSSSTVSSSASLVIGFGSRMKKLSPISASVSVAERRGARNHDSHRSGSP